MANKSKYWVAVCYPENMINGWEDSISQLLQIPYAYCIHDKDLTSKDGESRKVHVHILVAFSNTTTEKFAKSCFDTLTAPGMPSCFSGIQQVFSVRNMYDYLIHDTSDCRKKGKFQYSPSDRVLGNNFDIGSFEQKSTLEKNDMAKELCNVIISLEFTNFADFYMFVVSNMDGDYFEILKSNSGLLDRICKGVYLRNLDRES